MTACSHCARPVETAGESVCKPCFDAHDMARPCARCEELFRNPPRGGAAPLVQTCAFCGLTRPDGATVGEWSIFYVDGDPGARSACSACSERLEGRRGRLRPKAVH